jgi:hypothetical protein
MFSPDDNPGIFYSLVGVIVVVMTAVGLSILMEKRMKSSSGTVAAKREVKTFDSELKGLQSRYDEMAASLANLAAERGPVMKRLEKVRGELPVLSRRKAELTASIGTLRETIRTTEEDFAAYRETYRRQARLNAVGEKIGLLTIRGGREFRNVTISEVTDVGLEIRHEHGIARIHAPDLDADWQDRFQWTDEERRTRLKQELGNRLGLEPAGDTDPAANRETGPVVTSERPEANVIAPDGDAAQIQVLRTQVIGWTSKVKQLSYERAEASSKAGYGSQHSVPGSLETWSAKASRLSGELARAKVELSVAKGKLAALAAGDPLLRTPANRGF